MSKSEKDLEAIITEILASSAPTGSRRKPVNAGDRRPASRHNTYIARPRKRRSSRNPLYTSLRLIIMGLVILLVPLLFSVQKIPPPKSTITGALAHDPVVFVQLVDALPG